MTEPFSINLPGRPRLIGDIWAILCGVLFTLAFAPFNIFIFSLLCPAFLLILWLKPSPRRAFLRGWLFGLGFFGSGASWVYVSIYTFGQSPVWLALLITGSFVFTLALFPAVQGYLLTRLLPINDLNKCLLAFPASWVLLEWARSWFLTGFPWLYLGYSQMDYSLRGLAPIFSVYGVSWAVAFTSGAFVVIALTKQRKRQTILLSLLLAVLWGVGGGLASIQWTKPQGEPITASLIQGNIPQQLKWQPEQVDKTLTLYRDLTRQHENSSLIVWPEAAITLLQTQAQDYLNQLDTEAKAKHYTVITGIPIYQDDKFYNGMIALGDGQGTYLKRHLVPFGEFMPLKTVLSWIGNFVLIPMSDFSSGPRKQPELTANGITIGSYICYEIGYPNEVLDNLPAAQLLVTITDDSWFGRSLAPAQHLQMAQMRALETGRYLLMSTNDGITAIVDPQGKVIAFAEPFQETVLTGHVKAMTGRTPLIIVGIYPIIIFLFLLFVFAFIKQRLNLRNR